MVTSGSGKRRDAAYHHGDLRSALLTAARTLLAARGLQGLSLREVARHAGVSHAAPYRHFATKQDLVRAITAEGFTTLARACRDAGDRYPDDPAAQVKAAGLEYVRFAAEEPELIKLMFVSDAGDDGDQVLRVAADQAFGALAALIEAGQQQGVFRDGDIRLLTLAAFSTAHGLAMLVAADGLDAIGSTPDDLADVAGTVADVLLRGLVMR